MTSTIFQLPASATGQIVTPRFATAGPDTLRVFDFKNPSTYPAAITDPTTNIPGGSTLYDLPPATDVQQLLATVTNTGTTRDAQGYLTNAGWDISHYVALPNDFKLPAATGVDAHYLILMCVKPPSISAATVEEGIAGWGADTGANCNWAIRRTNTNAITFAGVGAANTNFGVLPVAENRIALEIIKTAAGQVTLKAYRAGLLYLVGNTFSIASIPQPVSGPTTPRLGSMNFGVAPANYKYGSIEIRNLALATMDVADIVAQDYATWAGRFT